MAASLLERARELGPELAASNAEADRLRRLPDPVWKRLVGDGFVRALQPARWGGGEVAIREFVDAVIEVGRASGSASWVMGVIGVHPWQLALFADRAQQEIWGADATRMHSSSYQPSGKAAKVPSGYRVSGRWSFSSGSDHCTAVNLGAVAGVRDMGGVELADFRSFLLVEGDYVIDDNWHTTGMRGTGSKDIVVDDAFVPEHRSQSHLDYLFDRDLPGWELNDGPLYRLPWAVVFNFALAASVYGMALNYVDAWVNEAAARATRTGPIRDDALSQDRLAGALYDIDAAIARMREHCDTMWQAAVAHEFLPKDVRARMRYDVNRGAVRCGDAVAGLHHASSGRSIFENHPLATRFADVQGSLGHAFLMPDSLGRTVGAYALGGSPVEFML